MRIDCISNFSSCLLNESLGEFQYILLIGKLISSITPCPSNAAIILIELFKRKLKQRTEMMCFFMENLQRIWIIRPLDISIRPHLISSLSAHHPDISYAIMKKGALEPSLYVGGGGGG